MTPIMLAAEGGEVYDLINSVGLEEMLHMGFACNMLKEIGGTPEVVTGTPTAAVAVWVLVLTERGIPRHVSELTTATGALV
jgi:hypothetical protein